MCVISVSTFLWARDLRRSALFFNPWDRHFSHQQWGSISSDGNVLLGFWKWFLSTAFGCVQYKRFSVVLPRYKSPFLLQLVVVDNSVMIVLRPISFFRSYFFFFFSRFKKENNSSVLWTVVCWINILRQLPPVSLFLSRKKKICVYSIREDEWPAPERARV